MSLKSLLSVIAVFLTLSGCVQMTPLVTPTEAADPSSAYLYGNFAMVSRKGNILALEVKQLPEGQVYYIKFRADGRLTLNKVAPGRYVINRLMLLSVGNKVEGKRDLGMYPFNTQFEVAPGRAYYLGDFSASSNMSVVPGFPGVGGAVPIYMAFSGEAAQSGDTFQLSTQRLTSEFPGLQSLATERAFKPR